MGMEKMKDLEYVETYNVQYVLKVQWKIAC